MKTLKHIEVVRSHIKGLSSMSVESAEAIVSSLSNDYSDVILTAIDTLDDLQALIARKPDLVFLGMMHLPHPDQPGVKVWMSQWLENASIAHTGSTHYSHRLELNKDLAKQHMIEAGIATAPFRLVHLDQPAPIVEVELPFPLFVKPLRGGGGQGVDEYSIVRTPKQLADKIRRLQRRHSADVMIEQYLEGREFSVAVIDHEEFGGLVAMPIELIAPKDSNGERMLSSSVKSLNQEQAIAVTDPEERTTLMTFALDVFRTLGARDYGRIDIRMDSFGVPHFLEANLIPSLISGYGSFPKAYKLNYDVEYSEMIARIATLGLGRTHPHTI